MKNNSLYVYCLTVFVIFQVLVPACFKACAVLYRYNTGVVGLTPTWGMKL
jgi:hypothetical protein